MTPDEKAALMLKLKTNKLIRVCAYPYQNLKRLKLKSDFINSEYSRRILALKNNFKGKRCFIIGNGPSLTAKDLDALVDEYSFAANRVYHIFNNTIWRPTFFTCIDPEAWLVIQNDLPFASNTYYFINISCGILKYPGANIYPIYEYDKFRINKYDAAKPHISKNADLYLSSGHTVTFTNIQLAFYMGFKEVYLLGVDNHYSRTYTCSGKIIKDNKNKDYFEGMPKSKAPAILSEYVTSQAYKAAKEYADAHGIKINNATRGGKLEAFERVDFDSLFPNT